GAVLRSALPHPHLGAPPRRTRDRHHLGGGNRVSRLDQLRACRVDGCDREHVARGFCGAHYARWQRGKSLTAPIRVILPPEERFWRSVNKESAYGCWLWTAATNGVGYGVFEVDGGRVYVHRFSYELHRGQIP